MNNFAIKVGNKEYWISRSIAAAGFIFTIKDGVLLILAAQRGGGAADNIGKWNCPCGYLDYNETVAQCCSREILEETNFSIIPKCLKLLCVNDDPDENRQNVTFQYIAQVDWTYKCERINNFNCEPGEVQDVKWIAVDRIDDFEWAFNHNNIIKQIVNDHYLNSSN